MFDIRKRIIPNSCVFLVVLLGIINSYIHNSLPNAIAGAFIPSILFVLLPSRQRWIGAGDIKLLSGIGIWVGWLLNIYVLLIACIISILFAGAYRMITRNPLRSIPFAPFLSLGALSLSFLSIVLLP